ncbi:Deoxyhypusine hydroxylase [Penaeus vannamei]|uniref:Deoxyhypusine hydroxylase n=1 Tax=Penaeus vannamei TaxID=6689 RepID=A0A3R7PQN5_PENVA|nr:Deoxyhypusine hydroxylase [Penaeus vannamei]
MVPDNKIEAIGSVLKDEKRPLKERFRALFTLRNLGGDTAIAAISQCFDDPSALLKHELAYCLGQMGDVKAIPKLIEVLKDVQQEPMVRHEAGEALGAIGDPSVLTLLREYSKDPVVEVAETCQLAVGRIEWLQSEAKEREKFESDGKFLSVDPTPPSTETSTEKHEIGYVLGQMASDAVVDELAAVVRDEKENEMVRHEAAEALGSVATERAMAVLKDYLGDEARVVRESCEVALDMSEYENSSEFQYADGLVKLEQQQSEKAVLVFRSSLFYLI